MPAPIIPGLVQNPDMPNDEAPPVKRQRIFGSTDSCPTMKVHSRAHAGDVIVINKSEFNKKLHAAVNPEDLQDLTTPEDDYSPPKKAKSAQGEENKPTGGAGTRARVRPVSGEEKPSIDGSKPADAGKDDEDD